jgi:hypothetical protein
VHKRTANQGNNKSLQRLKRLKRFGEDKNRHKPEAQPDEEIE